MNTETTVGPISDGEALERVEAAFLCCEMSVLGLPPKDLVLSVADIRALGIERPAGAEYAPLRPTVRTRSARCC